jgi:TatD DNase family protein
MLDYQLIDTHAHLHGVEFDNDREQVIERAVENGVTRIVTVGVENGLSSARKAILLAEKYDFIWATVGIHPHDAKDGFDYSKLRELALHPRCVAIGETGLDFYRNLSPVDAQEQIFRKQIELALEVEKPLVIHCREAGPACLEILQDYDLKSIGGVFHCYAEDEYFAQKLFTMGFFVSIPGTVTFKKAFQVKKTAQALPLDQLLLETDAPYLAPEPYRGKRCESSFLLETAKAIAALKNIELAHLANTTTQNAIKLFGI